MGSVANGQRQILGVVPRKLARNGAVFIRRARLVGRIPDVAGAMMDQVLGKACAYLVELAVLVARAWTHVRSIVGTLPSVRVSRFFFSFSELYLSL